MLHKTKHKGFTLIELLVVIAIIGLLSTLAVVALNNAREKGRDAKRVADIKSIQTALELYFADQNTYPPLPATTLGGGDAECLSEAAGGFTAACSGQTYMGKVPKNPLPAGAEANYTYIAKSTTANTSACTTEPCKGYVITFALESPTGDFPVGTLYAIPSGVSTTNPDP
jgi:general secretion pathway protein G